MATSVGDKQANRQNVGSRNNTGLEKSILKYCGLPEAVDPHHGVRV
jgi:hypothetical protein